MKQLVIGVLAHVDAGKTTLSEALLYTAGAIPTLGRVDHRDAYLDTHDLERARGITIFSKQALFRTEGMAVTLLDTPGHVDFSTEMERTLQVLDYAILVISATDGVQAHTETLWRLLRRNHIPTFLFVTKMDLPNPGRAALLAGLQKGLDEGCLDFTTQDQTWAEAVALREERLLEHIRRASQGRAELEPKIQNTVMQEYARLRRSERSLIFFINNVAHLTPAEHELVKLLLQDKKVAEIARLRCVEVVTVKTQIKGLLHKFGCSRTKEIVKMIRQMNLEHLFQ